MKTKTQIEAEIAALEAELAAVKPPPQVYRWDGPDCGARAWVLCHQYEEWTLRATVHTTDIVCFSEEEPPAFDDCLPGITEVPSPTPQTEHLVAIWADVDEIAVDHWYWPRGERWIRYGPSAALCPGEVFSLAPADQKPEPLTEEQIAALPRVTALPC